MLGSWTFCTRDALNETSVNAFLMLRPCLQLKWPLCQTFPINTLATVLICMRTNTYHTTWLVSHAVRWLIEFLYQSVWSSVRSRTFGTAEGLVLMARSIRRNPCAGCWVAQRSAAQYQACMCFIHSCAAPMEIHSLSPSWRSTIPYGVLR